MLMIDKLIKYKMMGFKLRTVLIVELLIIGFLSAGNVVGSNKIWIPLEAEQNILSPEIRVEESNQTRTVLHLRIPGFLQEETLINNRAFQKIELPGYTNSLDIGKPSLPVVSALVAIPDQATVEFKILESTSYVEECYLVSPAQKPKLDIYGFENSWNCDDDFYCLDTFYPNQLVSVDEPGIWRDLRIIRIGITPFQYNPKTRRLRIFSDLVIELKYSNAMNTNARPYLGHQISHNYYKVYQNSIINFEELYIPYPQKCVERYLVITPEKYLPSVEPLINWKKEKGLDVRVVTFVSADTTFIKNTIINDYYSRATSYVLLVGNDKVDWLQDTPLYWNHIGMVGTIPTDYWYALIEGNDYYPELDIARITGDESDIAVTVEKIIKYETLESEQIQENLDYLKNALFVAGMDIPWVPGVYRPVKEDIRTTIMSNSNFLVDTAYGESGATNDDVFEAFIKGVGIVNYRGHGDYIGGWIQWNYQSPYVFSVYEIEQLSNDDLLPIVLNLTCSNSAITYPQKPPHPVGSSSEHLLWHSTGGGVGVWGATRPSWRPMNNILDQEFFRGLFEADIYNAGAIQTYAKVNLLKFYSGHPDYEYAVDNAWMYIWLGDPEMPIWTDTPQQLTVLHRGIISVGEQYFTVRVKSEGNPVNEALVCLWKGDEVYVSGYTNANGKINFNINPRSPGDVKVTVTCHNKITYRGKSYVTPLHIEEVEY